MSLKTRIPDDAVLLSPEICDVDTRFLKSGRIGISDDEPVAGGIRRERGCVDEMPGGDSLGRTVASVQ